MHRAHIIGIGMGNPGHLTQDAVTAIQDCDVFLVPDKGEVKSDMVEGRRAVCEAVKDPATFRFITVPDPERRSDGEPNKQRYRTGVGDWRMARAKANAAEIAKLNDDAVIGFLAWGDPAFYDSMIRMVEDIATITPLHFDVIPGLAAFQILAAESRVGLNTIGASVHITPGRRLVDEWSPELGTVVVMLDSYLRVAELAERSPDLYIVWGAYLGMDKQRLIEGRLGDVIDDIVAVRTRMKEENGWVMDTYALWPNRP